MERKLKILLCSSEIVPFAKTGGLADVSGALPIALERLGIEVKVMMPYYKSKIAKCGLKIKKENGTLYSVIGKNVRVYFIENDGYFDRENLYGGREGDYPDNLDRFSFFCVKILEELKRIGFRADVIHCNDWQTALVPVYLKTLFKNDPFYSDMRTILTIHNLAYQGSFPKEEFPKAKLGWEFFNIDGLEYYGNVNLIKGGIVFSTLINTVSPTYSKEIQTKEFGCGQEGILAKRENYLYGILNGIDYREWDPARDKKIIQRYSVRSLNKKQINKKDLQTVGGLDRRADVPIVGLISRLADQKGLDLIADVIDEILNLDLQFILLGTGDDKYHRLFEEIKVKYPQNASINLKFDDNLARKIYAGSDMFLMPSRFEPCGLGQLISLRYGTIPIVRRIGGLADTVFDYNPQTGEGNGFAFTQYSSHELLKTIKRALAVYCDKPDWKTLVERGMKSDFSWEHSTKSYIEIYKRAMTI